MKDNLIITGAGRHVHSFKNCTLSGLMFFVKPSLVSSNPRPLNTAWDLMRISVKDNSGVGTAVDVLPPVFTLGDIAKIQTVENQALLVNYQELLPNVTGTYAVPLMFGTNKVLKGDNSIDVSVLIQVFTNFLEVEVAPIYSIGLESHKYVIEELELDKTKTRQTLSLGSSVDKIIYLGDLSKITRAKLSSDIFSFEKEAKEMFVRNHKPYDTGNAVVYANGNPFLLASRSETSPALNGVKMELDFESLPATNKLYIVRKITTPEIAREFIEKSEEHQAENLQKIRLSSVEDSCGCKHS